MKPLSTVTGILTYPVRTAGAVAMAGLRTTTRVVGWAIEQQAAGWPRPASGSQGSSDPGPANKVPLKSQPTPSMPAALRSVDANDVPAPAPATKASTKKTPAKKTPAKKTLAKKAPSKKAAVLAPALGLTEDEVLGASDVDKG